MKTPILLIFLALTIFSCEKKDVAQKWVDASIKAHGLHRLDGREISFQFRGKSYSALRTDEGYVYRRSFQEGQDLVEDELINSDQFSRKIKDSTVLVVEEIAKKYRSSINSVLYFVQLPYTLNDPAAIKQFKGFTEINGEQYAAIEVTFKSANGGQDHDDRFVYWINTTSNLIDYLAYSYQTEGGGVRFRTVLRRTTIDGIVFQDYVNYEADKDSKLESLPRKFENDELTQLSLIENINISVKKP